MLIVVIALFLPQTAWAEPTNTHLLITEIQTGAEEYIEVNNPTDETLDFSEYRLEYYSANATSYGSPFKTFTATTPIYPGGSIIFSSNDYLNDQATGHFAKTLSDSGGTIRLSKQDGSSWITVDAVGWGSAKLFETSAHTKPGDNKSLSRKINSNSFVDNDNNSQDFDITDTLTPNSTNIKPVDENPQQPVDSDDTPLPSDNTPPDDPVPGQGGANNEEPSIDPRANLQKPTITELLPDPADPKTDANDEYIELYNPNDQIFDLAGYKLQTGNNFTYSFDLSGLSIPPMGYLVIYSKDSNLALSNTSSKARLLDNNSVVINQTDQYNDAEEGQAWSLIGGVWQWTSTPSPGALNLFTITTALSVIKSSKTTKAPKATTPKTTKAKSSNAKATKASPAKKTAKKEEKGPANNFEETQNQQEVHPLMLGGAGLFALSYGMYEYRFEATNFWRRFTRLKIFSN